MRYGRQASHHSDMGESAATGHPLQVVTTTDSREDADRLARLAVDARLAACAQVVGPIASTYRWQGSVETAEEWMVVMKTGAGRAAALTERLQAEHRYEQPEIVATEIVGGSPGYLAWVDEQTRPP